MNTVNTSSELFRLPIGACLPTHLVEVAVRRGWPSAVCCGIGGISDVVLAYYDIETREYLNFSVPGIVELVSLNGNLTERDGAPFWHLHACVADRTGRTWGGHLVSCTVALTLELAVWPMNSRHERHENNELGLKLLNATSHD